ncbi:MAG: deoxyribodipyrimidine photo-lyase [Bacteroidetes bacterium]|nr:MAG: deoxyribodipyrimidine photo-lyase [Bacteroidota bacterium]
MFSTQTPIAVFWFRRDLRLEDNAGLYHALKSGLPVLPLFIFDKQILDKLEDKSDARVTFIHQQVTALKEQLNDIESDICVKYGNPEEVWEQLLQEFTVKQVFTNHDYEPYAIARDSRIKQLCASKNVLFNSYKDQCIFEYDEVLKDDGTPYTVFTPYSKKWKAKLSAFYLKPYPTLKYSDGFVKTRTKDTLIGLEEMGFSISDRHIPPKQVAQGLIKKYDEQRNFPAIAGTTKLGIHFRFGTISIREKAKKAASLNETFLNELIWRDFYMMILAHYPHVAQGAFRKEYDLINWRNNEQEFEAWCNGYTGYPLVDAGMRELNATGFMHNRVRMVVASFLTKHLLIDWRWGEAYFAKKLLDFDFSANNGGWQWAAGCGTDAAPYFRVFNPQLQMEKFDKGMAYVGKWVPEWNTPKYVKPIVVHEEARKRCLEVYKKALAK